MYDYVNPPSLLLEKDDSPCNTVLRANVNETAQKNAQTNQTKSRANEEASRTT